MPISEISPPKAPLKISIPVRRYNSRALAPRMPSQIRWLHSQNEKQNKQGFSHVECHGLHTAPPTRHGTPDTPDHTYTRTRGERLEGTAPQALQEGPLASRTARMNRRRKQRKVDKCRGAESEPCTNRNNNPKCTALGKS